MKAALAEGLGGRDWLLPQGFTGADLLIGGNLPLVHHVGAQAFADIPASTATSLRIRERAGPRPRPRAEAAILADIEAGRRLTAAPLILFPAERFGPLARRWKVLYAIPG